MLKLFRYTTQRSEKPFSYTLNAASCDLRSRICLGHCLGTITIVYWLMFAQNLQHNDRSTFGRGKSVAHIICCASDVSLISALGCCIAPSSTQGLTKLYLSLFNPPSSHFLRPLRHIVITLQQCHRSSARTSVARAPIVLRRALIKQADRQALSLPRDPTMPASPDDHPWAPCEDKAAGALHVIASKGRIHLSALRRPPTIRRMAPTRCQGFAKMSIRMSRH